jgi:hypothetical protein
MGFLSKLTGGVDKDLLTNGQLGRGVILDVSISGTTVQAGGGLVERKCTFQLEVMLDGTPPFNASCSQRVAEVYIPQFQPGVTVVAVRVDPNDHSKVVIDFNSQVPTVTMAAPAGGSSAAEILATGRPARGIIVESRDLGVKSPSGVDMFAYALTIIEEGQPPRQVQVGNPTPVEARPLLFNGSRVPVKLGPEEHDVVIDWAAAIANPESV